MFVYCCDLDEDQIKFDDEFTCAEIHVIAKSSHTLFTVARKTNCEVVPDSLHSPHIKLEKSTHFSFLTCDRLQALYNDTQITLYFVSHLLALVSPSPGKRDRSLGEQYSSKSFTCNELKMRTLIHI